jgi:hypothetical protein
MKLMTFFLFLSLITCGKTANSQTPKSLDEWKNLISHQDFDLINQPAQLDEEWVKNFKLSYGFDLYSLKNPNDHLQLGDKSLIYAAKNENFYVIYYLNFDSSVSTTWLLLQKIPTGIEGFTGTPPFEYRSQPNKQAFKYFKQDIKNGDVDLNWFSPLKKNKL